MNYLIIVIASAIVLLGLVLIFSQKRKKLSHATGQKFIRKIEDTKNLDNALSILNSHKFFVAALSELFSETNLTAAQKIEKIAHRFPNKKKIWYFHRLRNQIAHEVEIKVSRKQATDARNNFIRALNAIMK